MNPTLITLADAAATVAAAGAVGGVFFSFFRMFYRLSALEREIKRQGEMLGAVHASLQHVIERLECESHTGMGEIGSILTGRLIDNYYKPKA